MPAFLKQDPRSPATLEAVLEAVVQLSTLDESEFTALASSGKLRQAFPFRPGRPKDPVADFATDDELVEASPLPLSARERAVLIQSSMSPGQNSAPVFTHEPLTGVTPESLDALMREFRSLHV